MTEASSSSSLLPLLSLLLLIARAAAAAEDAACVDAFRTGHENFVLDIEDAVKDGAVLLATEQVLSPEACDRACCERPRCNVALMDPAETSTCIMFNCVHRNRFVCRFVNQKGYQSWIRRSVFQKYRQGPQEQGDHPLPIAIAGRDVITQPGHAVTLSGIESLPLGDATIEHYSWTQLSGEDGVSMEKTDLPDQVRLSNLQPGSYEYQLTVVDSNDKSHTTEVKVLVLSPELTSLYCRAPVKVGPCRAAFPRWHYDATSGACKQFTFGGCKENNNNYLSKKECESACSGVKASERSITLPTTEVCGLACHHGQFNCSNGCCVDRSLECDGAEQCGDGSDEAHCSKLNQTFNRLLNIDINQKKARCSEPPLTGPCRASFTRWYYDPLNRKCNRFTYGGCKGNENNFDEEDTCSKSCEGVTERSVFFVGMFDRYEKDEDDSDSANIALAVLLSVAILALLAILTYCLLKRKKARSQRPVATSPAHVALSEQETLVYNSTTKPV